MSLYVEIQKHAKTSSGEVDLFKALQKSFKTFADVMNVHGTKYQMKFNNPLDITEEISCEIADLLIFVYDENEARFTYLQNKKAYSSTYLPNGEISIPLRQHYLLGNFPIIKAKNKSIFIPSTIFSGRILDSIGSLGVFYTDSLGLINMDYSIMNLMHTTELYTNLDYSSNKPKKFLFNGIPLNTRKIKGYLEIESCPDLVYFEQSIKALKIGEPIVASSPYISDYVLSLVEDAIRNNECEFSSVDDILKLRQKLSISRSQDINAIIASKDLPNFKLAVINVKKN